MDPHSGFSKSTFSGWSHTGPKSEEYLVSQELPDDSRAGRCDAQTKAPSQVQPLTDTALEKLPLVPTLKSGKNAGGPLSVPAHPCTPCTKKIPAF